MAQTRVKTFFLKKILLANKNSLAQLYQNIFQKCSVKEYSLTINSKEKNGFKSSILTNYNIFLINHDSFIILNFFLVSFIANNGRGIFINKGRDVKLNFNKE